MKNKKKKNKIRILLILMFVVSLGSMSAFVYYQKEGKAEEGEEAVVLTENQKLEEGTIQSIIGNEMELEDGSAYLVPVGTQIETKLGAETTFSRLRAKDQIQMLVEGTDQESILLKIWITG